MPRKPPPPPPKGTRYGGRVAGTPNKSTANCKKALEMAFEGLGGVPALIEWAKEEPGEFYKIWAKLLPQDVKATLNAGGGGFKIEVVL